MFPIFFFQSKEHENPHLLMFWIALYRDLSASYGRTITVASCGPRVLTGSTCKKYSTSIIPDRDPPKMLPRLQVETLGFRDTVDDHTSQQSWKLFWAVGAPSAPLHTCSCSLSLSFRSSASKEPFSFTSERRYSSSAFFFPISTSSVFRRDSNILLKMQNFITSHVNLENPVHSSITQCETVRPFAIDSCTSSLLK